MTIFKKLPGSLALQRGTIISDGAFFNLYDDGKQEALHVMYHGIRGTQNVAGNKEKGAATGNSQAREVSNIQLTESAKLQPNAKLLVKWDLRFIDLSHVLFASASKAGSDKTEEQSFRQAFLGFVDRAKQSEGLQEVARRYVRNIVNGRWLWRNRIFAESITIQVSVNRAADSASSTHVDTYSFDALAYNLKTFDDVSADEQTLADVLLQGLKGESTSAAVHIEAIVDFGMGGIEVFPSQNYLEEKQKGFSRSLYQLNPKSPIRNINDKNFVNDNQFLGQAALRDQKIGNALRTIDTWYPLFNDNDQKPIAVEPNGANLEGQIFYRVGKDKSGEKVSAFDILKEVDELDPNSEKGMFLIACLIRGGVYSEGD